MILAGKNIKKDCKQRVYASGKAIADVPKSLKKAHDMTECSNRGICDRSSGERKCFHPFTGFACELMTFPNDCSGDIIFSFFSFKELLTIVVFVGHGMCTIWLKY